MEVANKGKMDCVNISTIGALNSFHLGKIRSVFASFRLNSENGLSIESIFKVYCCKWLLLCCAVLCCVAFHSLVSLFAQASALDQHIYFKLK